MTRSNSSTATWFPNVLHTPASSTAFIEDLKSRAEESKEGRWPLPNSAAHPTPLTRHFTLEKYSMRQFYLRVAEDFTFRSSLAGKSVPCSANVISPTMRIDELDSTGWPTARSK